MSSEGRSLARVLDRLLFAFSSDDQPPEKVWARLEKRGISPRNRVRVFVRYAWRLGLRGFRASCGQPENAPPSREVLEQVTSHFKNRGGGRDLELAIARLSRGSSRGDFYEDVRSRVDALVSGAIEASASDGGLENQRRALLAGLLDLQQLVHASEPRRGPRARPARRAHLLEDLSAYERPRASKVGAAMVAKLTEPLPATLTREQAEALVRDYGPSAGIVDERGIAAALSRFDGDPAPRSLPEACAVAITLDCARFAGVDPKALSRKALELEVRRSRRQPSAG